MRSVNAFSLLQRVSADLNPPGIPATVFRGKALGGLGGVAMRVCSLSAFRSAFPLTNSNTRTIKVWAQYCTYCTYCTYSTYCTFFYFSPLRFIARTLRECLLSFLFFSLHFTARTLRECLLSFCFFPCVLLREPWENAFCLPPAASRIFFVFCLQTLRECLLSAPSRTP